MYPPVRRHQTRTHLEFVRVGVRPAHDPLQIMVQARQRPMVGDEHPPPDEGDHLQQFDAQCHGFGRRRSCHDGLLQDLACPTLVRPSSEQRRIATSVIKTSRLKSM
jgi:hypothetical protein